MLSHALRIASLAALTPLTACAQERPAPGAPNASPVEAAAGRPSWAQPPATAERWAPELHSRDGWTFTPTFTPDLRTAYLVRWDAPDFGDPSSIQELFVTTWDDATEAWASPERVEATAGWRVDWPHVAPDGRRVLLSSTRPHAGHYRYADGRASDDFDLWAANLSADGQVEASTLRPLDGPDLNRQKTPQNARIRYVHNETSPRTDLDGRLVFWTERLDDGGGRRDAYLAEPDGAGGWQAPTLLPFNTPRRESGVAIDPNGEWIVFASEGRGGEGASDLFVVARDGDGWGEPANLGPSVNSPAGDGAPEVSPDGRMLFFTSTRPGAGISLVDDGEGRRPASTPYWVDLEAVPAFREVTGLARR